MTIKLSQKTMRLKVEFATKIENVGKTERYNMIKHCMPTIGSANAETYSENAWDTVEQICLHTTKLNGFFEMNKFIIGEELSDAYLKFYESWLEDFVSNK